VALPQNRSQSKLAVELSLLGILASLWGSSYVFIKVAVADIPPVTLIAARVSIAAIFLCVVMVVLRERLPSDTATWRLLFVQSFLNSFGAWTILAWGQQHIDSALASVLNSTAPIFVFLLTAVITHHEAVSLRRLFGAVLGFLGVVLIIGTDAISGLSLEVTGQLAALLGALLYAGAAIFGHRLAHITPLAAATGTMVWASVILIPASLIFDRPWTLSPAPNSIMAVLVLSIACTGIALLIYFRLIKTLGSLGTASQAYLRAGVGVILGMLFLGELLSLSVAIGIFCALVGVAAINWPHRRQ
jgi:drug/metabolite transporter (DMT)-like permease